MKIKKWTCWKDQEGVLEEEQVLALLKATPHRARDGSGTAREQECLAWSEDGCVQTELPP